MDIFLLFLTLDMSDESRINVVLQDNSIHTLLTEQVDILALLDLIGHIVDDSLRLLLILFFLSRISSFLCFFFLSRFYGCDVIWKSEVLAVQILQKGVIQDLLTEFLLFDAAVFDERADVIPVFLIVFTVGLAHAGELVCNLFGNIIGNLLNKTIVLECTSGNIQRQIRAVDHTF